jgi:hypothetical protein
MLPSSSKWTVRVCLCVCMHARMYVCVCVCARALVPAMDGCNHQYLAWFDGHTVGPFPVLTVGSLRQRLPVFESVAVLQGHKDEANDGEEVKPSASKV